MSVINIHEAKTNFSRLIEEVNRGGEVIIAKAGKPAARLVPMQATRLIRKPGALKGQIRIAEDFNGPFPDDIQAGFEGR